MLFLLFKEKQIGEEVRRKRERTIVSISLKMVLILTTLQLENRPEAKDATVNKKKCLLLGRVLLKLIR